MGFYLCINKETVMHVGKIKKLVRERGFGFIGDTDGREVFFHRSSLVNTPFESLSEEQEVEFDVEKSPKGPCAVNVRLSQK
jgi:CspA family cold shock protein